jgi:hypothetical protein
LEQSIIDDGCYNDICVWRTHKDDKEVEIIIDGYNRYEICKKHDVDFYTNIIPFILTRNDAKIWMVQNQLGRRNLPDAAKIELALVMESIIQERAKENQKLSQGRGKRGLTDSANLNDPVKPVNTRKEVAKIAGTSEDSVSKFKKIKNDGSPELVHEVLTGQKSINAAHKEVKQVEAEQQNILPLADIVTEKPSVNVDIESEELRVLCVYISEITRRIDIFSNKLDEIDMDVANTENYKNTIMTVDAMIEASSNFKNRLNQRIGERSSQTQAEPQSSVPDMKAAFKTAKTNKETTSETAETIKKENPKDIIEKMKKNREGNK